MKAASALQVLIVDDEALARKRLRSLLSDCDGYSVEIAGEAASVAQAKEFLSHTAVDAIFLDIHMPDVSGLSLAQGIHTKAQEGDETSQTTPAIVFVTAHPEHAVVAFELAAIDYLTKPVRLDRLQKTLQKIEQLRQSIRRLEPENTNKNALEAVLIHERGQLIRIPVAEVLYFKAELKYISVRTAAKTHLLEGSLNDLEQRFSDQFLRVHRNALVARRTMRALEQHDFSEGEGWAVRLDGVDEVLAVSRRQLAAVRDALTK